MGNRVTDRSPSGEPTRIALAIALIVGMAVAQGCATATSRGNTSAPSEGPPTRTGAELLAQRVLDGLAANDVRMLSQLVVTKGEFCGRVFPELPSSKVPNVTCDFVWEMAMLHHEGGLQTILGEHKGKRYSLVSVRFAEGVQTYPSFKVHKTPVARVRDAEGAIHDYRLFGDVLEIDGEYRLFGFSVD